MEVEHEEVYRESKAVKSRVILRDGIMIKPKMCLSQSAKLRSRSAVEIERITELKFLQSGQTRSGILAEVRIIN